MSLRLSCSLALAALAAGSVLGCDCGGGGELSHAELLLRVDPEQLDFGPVFLGTSKPLAVTLTNKGNARLSISEIEIDGGDEAFTLGDDGDFDLDPQEDAALSVSFAPRAQGPASATLRFTADDKVKNHAVTLTGVGVKPGLEVINPGERCNSDPASVSFGSLPTGQAADRTITLRSSGTATVTIGFVQIESAGSTEFSLLSSPQGTALPPEGTVDVQLRYLPADLGPDVATLVLRTGAGEIRVPLCGEGTTAALCGMPVPIDVGRVVLGRTGNTSFRVSNCGTTPLTVSAVAISSDPAHPSSPGFNTQPPALPQSLNPGDGFDVAVSYTPPAAGAAAGYLRVDSTANGQPSSWFPIQASGGEDCAIQIVPARLAYFGVPAGSMTLKRLAATNAAGMPCSITRIGVTQGANVFSVAQAPFLPATLAPGDTAVVGVQYAPAGTGPDQGVLEIEAGASVHRIDLAGNAPPGPGCHLDVVPAFVSFGAVAPGSSRPQTIAVNNPSATACAISSIALAPGSNAAFGAPSPTMGNVPPGGSLMVTVTYTPAQPGSAMGTLRITSNDASSPMLDVPLFASAAPPGICVNPTRLQFGNVQGSRDIPFEIIACGTRAVQVTGLPFTRTDPQFTLVTPPALPFNLAAGARQNVVVRYTPTSAAGGMATIDVRSDDPVSPSIPVTLEGGAQIVPPAAGRYLYYWKVTGQLFGTGDIMRLPLQGMSTATPFWGGSTGKPCAGCHALSPDGRYMALVESTFGFSLKVIDTMTGVEQTLPFFSLNTINISWRPDINSTPPYQFAVDEGGTIQIGALSSPLRQLRGAADASFKQRMPSWGPNGKIAFVRGRTENPPDLGFGGTSDVLVVDEGGGTAQPLAGASGNGFLNYYPSYSPNGRWIAISVSRNGMTTYSAMDARVKLVAADNSGRVLDLPNAVGNNTASFPTWSQDGTYLSFSSNRAGGLGGWDIWYAPVDPMTGADSAAMNLREANTAGFDHVARWSP